MPNDKTFIREDRFIVVKRKHLSEEQERDLREGMRLRGIGTVECVVVESDWPEYEQVWHMIEARCSGVPNDNLGDGVTAAVELMGEALFMFSGRMKMAGVFASGSTLTDAHAASYERVVAAWEKLTSGIARAKLPTWDHYAEEPVANATVPRDVAESWKTKAENYQQERAELLADISDMMANHVDNWPAPKKLQTAITLIDKTLRASRDELAALKAKADRLEGALAKRAFVMSEKHLSGARVCIGFETFDEAFAAHMAIVEALGDHDAKGKG